jgi:hypothetical protein
MNAHPSSLDADVRDARTRGWRTLAQGLAVDVLAGASVALVAATSGGIEWSQAYWVTLGLAVAKSAITAAVSYVARLVIPPAVPTTRRGGTAG